jgi:hypothetical protein
LGAIDSLSLSRVVQALGTEVEILAELDAASRGAGEGEDETPRPATEQPPPDSPLDAGEPHDDV